MNQRIKLNICYLGLPKAGKTSIIKHVFFGMTRDKTMNLPETKVLTEYNYQNYLLNMTHWELPAEIKDAALDATEAVMTQMDAFIFVVDMRFGEYSKSCHLFKAQFQKIMKWNPGAAYYVFFHQTDLDFLYEASKIEETINNFNAMNKQYLDEPPQTKINIMNKKTTIYDNSICER